MTTQFPPDSKVVERRLINYQRPYHVGTVLTVLPDGRHVVEWYSPGSGSVDVLPEDELISEKDAIELAAALKATRDRMEAEFEAHKPEFQAKVASAVELVKDARKIALSCNKKFTEVKGELQPLFNLLKEYGWSQSTINC